MDAQTRSAGREAAGQTTRRWPRWSRIAASICVVGVLAVLGTVDTATAGTPLQIDVNGQPMSSSDPQVTADLQYDGSDRWLLTVTNPSSNPAGENITEIDGAVSQTALQQGIFINVVSAQSANAADSFVVSGGGISLLFSSAPVNACFQPPAAQESFTCPTMYGGFGPGSTEEYEITSNDTTESLPLLASINVTVMNGACTGHKNAQRSLAYAADNCTQPGNTRIAKAKINQKAGAASFAYKAKYATKYVCELLHDNHITHRTSCGAAKSYAGLDSGTYFFLVWGANRAGVAQKATVYGFKIE
jgi:hypothetical protein